MPLVAFTRCPHFYRLRRLCSLNLLPSGLASRLEVWFFFSFFMCFRPGPCSLSFLFPLSFFFWMLGVDRDQIHYKSRDPCQFMAALLAEQLQTYILRDNARQLRARWVPMGPFHTRQMTYKACIHYLRRQTKENSELNICGQAELIR